MAKDKSTREEEPADEPTQEDIDTAIEDHNDAPPAAQEGAEGPTQEDVEEAIAEHNASEPHEAEKEVHGVNVIAPEKGSG